MIHNHIAGSKKSSAAADDTDTAVRYGRGGAKRCDAGGGAKGEGRSDVVQGEELKVRGRSDVMQG